MAQLIGKGTSWVVWVAGAFLSLVLGTVAWAQDVALRYGMPRPAQPPAQPQAEGWLIDPPAARRPARPEDVQAMYGAPVPVPLRPRPSATPSPTPAPAATPDAAAERVRAEVNRLVDEAAARPLQRGEIEALRKRFADLGPSARPVLEQLAQKLDAKVSLLREQVRGQEGTGNVRFLATLRESLAEAERKLAAALRLGRPDATFTPFGNPARP